MEFLESMKIWQMGRLLQIRERPEASDIWIEWANSLWVDDRRETRQESDFYHLNDLPKVPAVLFLAYVAILCEKEQPAPRLGLDEIVETYFSGSLDEKLNLRRSIVITIPSDSPNNITEEQLQRHWLHILNSATHFLDTGINTNTSLQELLKRIQEANRQANDENQERLLHPISIETLIEKMEQYSAQWQQLSEKYAIPDPTVEMLCSLIQNGIKQIILTGAPGTGKTYAASQAARHLGTGSRIQMAQFHPSYDYTDFVEGLRPVQLEGETKSTFVRLDGSFKAFCRHVAEENRQYEPEDGQPERLYFFLIDEINRANLSQVFGELMFCLESDKREQPVQTQYRNLPTYRIGENQKAMPLEDDVFCDGFFIPKNVVIIGTMNDIDRSVESMDFAMRRRFFWHEVKAEKTLLKRAFESGNFGELLRQNAEHAAELVTRLNAFIEKDELSLGLSCHYDIAQGQFNLPCPKEESLEGLLQFVWKHRIEPLLREYVRGENPADVDKFIQQCAQALGLQKEE